MKLRELVRAARAAAWTVRVLPARAPVVSTPPEDASFSVVDFFAVNQEFRVTARFRASPAAKATFRWGSVCDRPVGVPDDAWFASGFTGAEPSWLGSLHSVFWCLHDPERLAVQFYRRLAWPPEDGRRPAAPSVEERREILERARGNLGIASP